MLNETIRTLMSHRSIRKYEDESLPDEDIEKIVKAGRQAAFVSQMYSVIMEREKDDIPFGAPVMFTICVDIYKLEKMMEKRDWDLITNDLTLLLFGIQDASYMAQNMVIAAESMGLGTCYLGSPVRTARNLKEKYDLPDKVFPLVQLVVGYPAEDPPTRPRYPLDFVLFEDEYPEFSEKKIEKAMEEMDEGYLEEDYYRKLDAKISLKGDSSDEYTYEDYSWTEHISRKWGQWYDDPEKQKEILEACGFDLERGD
ncbi:MAG: nitroreductase family protein [Candidatus Thermoplasmatota archaeon]|nr:nitroreductase family protein [Candidatus Thermoplasmatota archaeon]MBS3790153.1 nitroreductase family protein [Candidatus Thermoplasmatota archaeon]